MKRESGTARTKGAVSTAVLVAVCLVMLVYAGCQSRVLTEPDTDGAGTQAPPGYLSVRERPIDVLEFGDGQQTVLVMGGIHGDEPSSVELTRALADHLRTLPPARFTRRVVVMPAVNPDGLAARTRWNARRIDLNRNFPSRDFGTGQRSGRYYGGSAPASEPETRAIMAVIDRYDPHLIISCHAPLACVNYDGPAEGIARRMAELNGFPVVAKLTPRSPGSLGTYYGKERGLPVITLELNPRHHQWNRHGPALLDAIGVVATPTP